MDINKVDNCWWTVDEKDIVNDEVIGVQTKEQKDKDKVIGVQTKGQKQSLWIG